MGFAGSLLARVCEANGTVGAHNYAIVLGMVRCAMITAKASKAAYGECVDAMCYVLDRTPAKTGGKLTRLELWHGRLLPKQFDRIRTWGCAFYLQGQCRPEMPRLWEGWACTQ